MCLAQQSVRKQDCAYVSPGLLISRTMALAVYRLFLWCVLWRFIEIQYRWWDAITIIVICGSVLILSAICCDGSSNVSSSTPSRDLRWWIESRHQNREEEEVWRSEELVGTGLWPVTLQVPRASASRQSPRGRHGGIEQPRIATMSRMEFCFVLYLQ